MFCSPADLGFLPSGRPDFEVGSSMLLLASAFCVLHALNLGPPPVGQVSDVIAGLGTTSFHEESR